MYIRKQKRPNGNYTIQIRKTYTDENGKHHDDLYEGLGNLWKLQKEHEDVDFWLQQKLDEYKSKEETGDYVFVKKSTAPIDSVEEFSTKKNLGYLIPLIILNYFDISRVCRDYKNNQKSKNNNHMSKDVDFYNILAMLVLQKIINPLSIKKSWEENDFFLNYSCDFWRMYDSLEDIAQMKPYIIRQLNRKMRTLDIKSKDNVVIYDLTNYHMETHRENDYLAHGKSKKNSKNSIIQFGLLQDDNEIPIDYNIYRGNTADCKTVVDIIQTYERDLKTELDSKIIMVSDRAMNTQENAYCLNQMNDGFVFGCSFNKKGFDKYRDWVIDKSDYKTFSCENVYENMTQKELEEGKRHKRIRMEKSQVIDFKIDVKENKSCIHEQLKGTVPVLLIATYDSLYAEKQKQKIREKIKQAKEKFLINNAPAPSKQDSNKGIARYIIFEENENGRRTGKRCFNSNAIKHDWEKAGHYLLMSSEINRGSIWAIRQYDNREKIEETFRLTNQWLETRPIRVWTEKSIEGVLLIMFIALCVTKTIEVLLKGRFSKDNIQEALSSFDVSKQSDEFWEPIFPEKPAELIETANALLKLVGLNHMPKLLSIQQIQAMQRSKTVVV